jgi:hypothetical protein
MWLEQMTGMGQYIYSMDWFKGKSTPETIDFPVKYGVFLYMFP